MLMQSHHFVSGFWIFWAAVAGFISCGECICSNALETVFVNESSSANSVIASLDSTFSSSFSTDAKYACYFTIASGALRLSQELNLENLTSCSTGSVIAAADIANAVSVIIACTSGSSQQTFVVSLTDINEFPPLFKPQQFYISISEASPVGTILIQLNRNVSDADKSNQETFNFYIVSGSGGKFNMIDGITSGIIRLQQSLDYDGGDRAFTMNVSAVELAASAASQPQPLTGFATVNVRVMDADDRNPAFTQQMYSLTVNENDSSIVNRPMKTNPPLLAVDQDFGINQTIAYAIDFGVWSGSSMGTLLYNISFLSINSSTGEIAVTEILDREALPADQILLQIRAYQTDKPDTRVARASVLVQILDKNDNAPVMNAKLYTAAVAENSPAGTFVAMVAAADADKGSNSTFTFNISDPSAALQIDPSTGVVSVRDAGQLDREKTPFINATVWAQENQSAESWQSPKSSLTVQLIDTNDNSPQSAEFLTLNVTAGSAAGTVAGSLVAIDADAGAAGTVSYSIVFASAGAAELFGLASAANASIVQKQPTAESAAGTYFLAVAADDGGAGTDQRRAVTVVQIMLLPSAATTTSTTQFMSNGSSTVTTQSTVTAISSQPQSQIPVWLLAICAALAASTAALLLAVVVLLMRNRRSNTAAAAAAAASTAAAGGGPAAAAASNQQPALLHLNGKANPIFTHPAADPDLPHSNIQPCQTDSESDAQQATPRSAAERLMKLRQLSIYETATDLVV